MGGQGSGTWYRWDKQSTFEEQLTVNIHYLKKQGWLRNGISLTLRWTCGEEESGSVGYRCLGDRVVFNFSVSSYGDDPEHYEKTVWLTHTPCNYGGTRPWFSCPHCQRRIGVLVIRGEYVVCRDCAKVRYACQQESKIDRASRRIRKIQKRLGNDDWYNVLDLYFPKPKGMHQRTYDRIVSQADRPIRIVESEAARFGWLDFYRLI